jgi:nitrite reductase/ring-hydroxylating ferredoxin subunit
MALGEQVPRGGQQALDQFLDDMGDDLKHGVLSPRVFSDDDVHRAELERIFTRCWVYVGHVSEIPSPGDYVLRYVGEDQFILVRDEAGQIRLLFNRCMHRASPVCRADRGNASNFRCPYHGWIYRNSGKWNGAPHRARAYRQPDPEAWSLRQAPHVDTYQGLIFACLDPGAMSLREYLGDMCWYLDVIFGLQEEGMRAVGDPHRWVVPANWKSGAENFVGDAYHFPNLHRSAEEVGVLPSVDHILDIEFHIALEGGHGLVANRGNLPEPWGIMDYPPEVVETFDLSRLDDGQRAFLEGRLGITVFTIFPNLSFIRAPGAADPLLGPACFTALRQWQPRGPGQMEIWNWPLVWNGAPDAFNQMSYDAGVHGFSSSGIFEQDDTVAWSGGPSTGRSTFARQSMKLNYQLGMDGMSDYELLPDWAFPGVASTSVYGEMNQLRWWQRWREEMMAR